MEADAQALVAFFNDVKAAQAFGVLVALAAALKGFVAVFKLPLVQRAMAATLGRIPKVGDFFVWDRLTPFGRTVVVLVLPAIAGAITAAAGGASWPAAIAMAVLTALSAIGANETRKTVATAAKEDASIRVKFPEDIAGGPR